MVAVADNLAAAGVFFVTHTGQPLAHGDFPETLSVLNGGGCRSLAVCSGNAQELRALEQSLALDALLLDAAPFAEGEEPDLPGLGRLVEEVRDHGYEPGLMLVPSRRNIRNLPRLLSFCRERQVGRIKLPNVPVDDRFSPTRADELLRPDDLDWLRGRLGVEAATSCAGLILEVHDLFLWEILLPGREDGRSEYGGCQAANSLAHVDIAGDLHPCSSWPEKLGSLLEHSLEELWQSPQRLRIRAEIAAAPPGCSGCRDYPLCLGGCRGLARMFGTNRGGRDPLCPQPR
jgi:GeoRSP system SPASM domain protein